MIDQPLQSQMLKAGYRPGPTLTATWKLNRYGSALAPQVPAPPTSLDTIMHADGAALARDQ